MVFLIGLALAIIIARRDFAAGCWFLVIWILGLWIT